MCVKAGKTLSVCMNRHFDCGFLSDEGVLSHDYPVYPIRLESRIIVSQVEIDRQ